MGAGGHRASELAEAGAAGDAGNGKKKLRELGAEGRLAAGLAEIVGEVEVEGPRLREGHDFVGQEQATALGARRGEVRRRVPNWALLVVKTLRELRMMRTTGQLPGGKSWTEQAAWKVEVWEAWWLGAEGE